MVSFPMKYLGLLITITRIHLVHLQFILDRIRARFAGWKGWIMSIAGPRVLVRCVLKAMPTFTLTVLCDPKKFFKDTDKARRHFLWAQEKELTSGGCKVNWPNVCSLVDCAGLGIHNLGRINQASRLRWLWLAWRHLKRAWLIKEPPHDDVDRALFASATTDSNEEGNTAKFWNPAWLGATPLCTIFPNLYKHIRTKNATWSAALLRHAWAWYLSHGNDMEIATEFVSLQRMLNTANIELDDGMSDTIL